MKILILTVTAGAGHNMTSRALQDQFNKLYGDKVETKTVDVYAPGHRFISFFNNEFYFALLRAFPRIMRQEYRVIMSRVANPRRNGSRMMGKKATKKVLEEVKDFQPDAILAMHPYSVAACSILKEEGKLNCPLFAVVQNYVLLPHWENAYNFDVVFTSCEQVNKDLLKRGLKKEQLETTGIPIGDKYEKRPPAEIPFGVDPQAFTILILNGGTGLGVNTGLLKRIAQVDAPLQVLIVNGKNEKSRRKTERFLNRYQNPKHKVWNLGFVNNIYECMTYSDLYMGKAGGISLTEAIRMRLPLYIPLIPPYHEASNIEFLQERDFVIYDPKMERVADNIAEYIKNPAKLNEIRDAMARYPYRNSARKICERIYNYRNEKKINTL